MKKKNLDHLKNHKLLTRRDFLSHGLVSGSALAIGPSLLSFLFSRAAYGQECVTEIMAANMKTPVLIFDLAGGANIAGSNVMAGGQGGQMDFLADYSTLGLPMNMHPSNPGQLNTELGLAFHSDSGMLRGIQSVTNAATRANVDGCLFCNVSNDDTSNNPHNPAYWLNKAGAAGELVQIAGVRDSVSGGNSISPSNSVDSSKLSIKIDNASDARSLVTLGRLNDIFPDDNKVKRVLDTIQNMGNTRMAAFSSLSVPEQIKALIDCGYVQAASFLERYNSSELDPLTDPDVIATFNNLGNGDQQRTATIAKLLLDGYMGVGTVSKGGYDYHTGDRSTGEVRDFDAGQLIGRVLELARRKNKDLVIYVITDGGVAARGGIDNSADGRGKLSWTSENGERSSTFMLVYKNNGRPAVLNNKRQIGWMKANGSVETSANLISNSVPTLAKAVVANYLALHGDEGMLQEVVGDNPFGNNLANYIMFDKL